MVSDYSLANRFQKTNLWNLPSGPGAGGSWAEKASGIISELTDHGNFIFLVAIRRVKL